MALTNVVLSIDGKAYELPDFYGSILADGIQDIEHSPLNIEEAWYSLDGKKLSKPQSGINIIRYSDGTSKKVLIK